MKALGSQRKGISLMKHQFRHLFTKSLAILACLTLLAAAIVSFSPSAHADDKYYYNASFTSYCQQWQYGVDPAGFYTAYTPSNGGQNCANADWYLDNGSYPTSHSCNYWVFIPNYNATATAMVPGLWDTNGTKYYGNPINEQNYYDQWAYIGWFANINHVNIGDNDGETGTYLGLGTSASLLVGDCN